MSTNHQQVEHAYRHAQERFAELDVDTDNAIDRLRRISISLQCWQGDDVVGFEGRNEDIGGGLAVTGNYPGRARNADELRQDFETALRLIPGRHRVNLHAMYGETDGESVDRAEIEPRNFVRWIDWAKEHRLGL